MVKKYVFILLFLPFLVVSCRKVKEYPIEVNLVKNGSFEELKGDSLVGWSGKEVYSLSEDVPPGGGNYSISITYGCIRRGVVSQRIPIHYTSHSYRCSYWIKSDCSHSKLKGGWIILARHYKDTVIYYRLPQVSSGIWEEREVENLFFRESEIVEIILEGDGGYAGSCRVWYDLIRLELKRK